jgi:HEAT repeat protein/tetratricopeptide (TPR) repeat protein
VKPCIESESPSGLDRTIVADRVVEYLSPANRRLVILYGGRGSRKAELVRRWVVPRLPSAVKAEFAECDPSMPEFEAGAGSPEKIESALETGKMVFLAHADHCLFTIDERYPAALLKWLDAVEHGRVPGSLVLLVPEQSLSNVLRLQNLAPSLLSNILEIEPISFRESLLHLTSISEATDLIYDPSAVDILDRQAQQLSPVDPIELAQGIDQGLRYFKRDADRCVTVADCDAVGGIPGTLDELRRLALAHANERFGANSENIIEVILVESASCSKSGRAFDKTDLALRLGFEPNHVDEILTWLCQTERVLRRDRVGGFEPVPTELSAVVDQNASVSHKDISRGTAILRDGVRSWSQLGSVLPQKRLDEINSIREWLVTSDDEAVEVVRSLLRIANGDDRGNLAYWLRRIRSRPAQISVLLENLFAVSPALRKRAATVLARYDDREVLKQLHRVATEDPDPDVRAAALASLANMNTDELWPLVSQEAREPSSPYQVHAVACLRLFKDERSWQLLVELVSADEYSGKVKKEAIATLAELRTPESIKALVEIGLYNGNPSIRGLAAAALATTQSAELAQLAVDEVRHSSTSQRTAPSTTAKSLFAGAWQIAAGFAITAANTVVHGLALMTLRRFRPGLIFLGIEAALLILRATLGEEVAYLTGLGLAVNWLICQLMATRAAYSWLKVPGRDTALSWSRNPKPKSRFILSLFCWLLALDAIPIFLIHGVLHALAGRYKRSLKLLFFECVGVGCCLAAWYCFTSDIVAITPLPTTISRVMFVMYLVAGITIFVYTLAADLVPTVIEVFRNQSSGGGWRVKIDLLRSLATNQFAAEYLLQCAQTGSDADQRWARKIVRHTAQVMPHEKVIAAIASHENPSYLIRGLAPVTDKELLTAITGEMKHATPQVQKRIVDLLTCRPSEASLTELRPLRKTVGWYGRVRYSAGVWYHRLRVWPSGVLLVMILIAPFPILAAVEIIQTSKDPDRPVMRMVENSVGRGKLTDDQLLEALQFLAKFDRGVKPEDLQKLFNSSTEESRSIWTSDPSRLAIEVCSLPLDTGDSDQNQKLNVWRQQLFFLVAHDLESNTTNSTKALTTIRERDDHCGMNDAVKEKFVEAASLMLKDKPSDQQIGLALITLDTANTGSAVDQLKALLKSLDQTTDQRAATPDQARRDELRKNVIAALASNDSDAASSALDNIANSKSTSPKLAKIAKAQLQERMSRQEAVVLESVRTSLGNRDYETAYNEATRVLDSKPNPLFRDDVLELQATAAYNMALSPNDTGQWAAKAIDAFERVKNTPKWNTEHRQELSVAYQLRAWNLQQQGKMQESLPFVRNAIDQDPTLGTNYSLLYEVHISRIDGATSKEAKEAAIEMAVADFQKLAKDHPDEMWPRENLASLLHDRAFDFEQSYKMFVDLQRFRSSLSDADKLNMDSNFMEAKFTVGRYKEAGDAVRLLERQISPEDYGLRIPVALYAYMSAVELGNLDSAKTAWRRLLELMSQVPPTYKLDWRYDGTIQYLEQQGSSNVRQALLGLVVNMNEIDKNRQIAPQTVAESEAILHIVH